MSLPFARTRFDASILNVHQAQDDCYLLRTATTCLRFVVTRGRTWRVYDYGDKPLG